MKKPEIEVIGNFLRTKDYSIFKTHPVNRMIRYSKVQELVKLMEIRGWLQGSIVVVDKDYVIINGQHRVEAARITGVPVDFVQLPIVATAELIRENNLHHMSWSLEDTMGGFVAEGNPDYIELDEFRKRFPEIRFTDAMMIAKTSTRSAYRKELENGTFKMKDPELSEEWAKRVQMFKPYVPTYNARSFVRSLTKMFVNPDFNFDYFMMKVRRYPYMIMDYKQVDRNLEMFEQIYNKGNRKDKRVSIKNYKA